MPGRFAGPVGRVKKLSASGAHFAIEPLMISADGPEPSERAEQHASALPPKSDVNLFCYRKGVVDLDAEISNDTLDLSMPQKELYGSQVAGSAIDQGRLGPAQGMRPEQVRVQSDVSDPVRWESGILAGRHMSAPPPASEQVFS